MRNVISPHSQPKKRLISVYAQRPTMHTQKEPRWFFHFPQDSGAYPQKKMTEMYIRMEYEYTWQHSSWIFKHSRRMLSKNHLHVNVFRGKKIYQWFFFLLLLFCLTAFSSNIRVFEENAVKESLACICLSRKKIVLVFFFPWLLFCLTAFSSNIRRVCCQSYVYVFLRLSVGSLSFCIYLFWLFCFFGGDSQLARAFDRQEPPTPHAFSGYVLCVRCIYYICKGVIYAGIYYDVIHTYWICIMYTM